ncbi:MAG: hypothetical protein GEV28_11395 [Actinophytocola sp.]|uniref:hypothetical protein n=1 Tax=Actinophytocola sp. TaxID=1872138 RepID=UPI00132A2278|nr:hypothetical protein [Actinophytocola sp.]MPZ80961.1 hypothetical protein [Actinophytocola sp.]
MCETDRCEMWAWQLSRYDERVHAFVTGERPASFVEAACSHSVPIDKITRSHAGPRCIACLLIVGDHLAEHHRMGAGC